MMVVRVEACARCGSAGMTEQSDQYGRYDYCLMCGHQSYPHDTTRYSWRPGMTLTHSLPYLGGVPSMTDRVCRLHIQYARSASDGVIRSTVLPACPWCGADMTKIHRTGESSGFACPDGHRIRLMGSYRRGWHGWR